MDRLGGSAGDIIVIWERAVRIYDAVDLSYVAGHTFTKDFDPDAVPALGATPPHWAADAGCLEALSRLAEAGADLEAETHLGGRPLHEVRGGPFFRRRCRCFFFLWFWLWRRRRRILLYLLLGRRRRRRLLRDDVFETFQQRSFLSIGLHSTFLQFHLKILVRKF